MATVPGLVVANVLGWKASDDKQFVLLGIRTTDNQEYAIALDEERLMDAITSLIGARAAYPADRGADMVNEIGLETNWFDFGINDETGNHFVRFRLQNGGHMSFVMDKTMAVRLTEIMNVAVLGTNIPTSPGPKN